MTFEKAVSLATGFGVARAPWMEERSGGYGKRAVRMGNGLWMIVEDDDRYAGPELSIEDMKTTDWKPLTGAEWPMKRNVEPTPPLRMQARMRR